MSVSADHAGANGWRGLVPRASCPPRGCDVRDPLHPLRARFLFQPVSCDPHAARLGLGRFCRLIDVQSDLGGALPAQEKHQCGSSRALFLPTHALDHLDELLRITLVHGEEEISDLGTSLIPTQLGLMRLPLVLLADFLIWIFRPGGRMMLVDNVPNQLAHSLHRRRGLQWPARRQSL